MLDFDVTSSCCDNCAPTLLLEQERFGTIKVKFFVGYFFKKMLRLEYWRYILPVVFLHLTASKFYFNISGKF